MTPPGPLQPRDSFPARLCAGDQYAWTLQTTLTPGVWLFYVLTGVVANRPLRYILNEPTMAGSPPAPTGGVQVAADGSAAFAVTSPVTATWQPGRYQWILFSLDATGDRNQVAQGEIRIEPNPLGAVPADPRSPNERLLAAIRLLLEGKALDDTMMYKVGGRELTKIPIKDLEEWHGIVEARVRREFRRKQGKSIYRRAPVFFGGRP